MDEINQISQAILVASDPTQAALHQEALQFVQNSLKNSPDSWKIGLALFMDTNPDGSRKYQPQVRFYGLRVLEEFLDSRFDPLSSDSFEVLRQSLMTYVQSEYVRGTAEAGAPCESVERLRMKFGVDCVLQIFEINSRIH